MRTETILIEGEPVAKGRPRVRKYKGKSWAYTPEKTRNYERAIVKAWNNQEQFTGALKVKIEAYMQAPQKPKTDRPTKAPDADNIAKTILDGLNKVAWEDDKQIVDLHVEKFWSSSPYVKVTISEVVE